MVARKKVVAPVTPRIVYVHPRQRLVRYGLLLCAFLTTGWLSYEYGRSSAPGTDVSPAEQSHASNPRITELEQERDTLKYQVAELEQSVKQAGEALVEVRSRNSKPKPGPEPDPVVSSTRELPAAEPVSKPPGPADRTLVLKNIHIERTSSENGLSITFSVINKANNNDRVTGTIWIAVNGFSDNTPRRLSFKTLSTDRRSYVKMGFNQQQDVAEILVLPDGFRLKNIQIEVKPYGKKYTGTSEKVTWTGD